MKFKGKIKRVDSGYLFICDDIVLSTFDGEEIIMDIKKAEGTRTIAQNSALHLYFSQLANALNDAGYDMKKTLKQQIDIPWTMETVKNHLWRPIQKAYLQKESTTRLNKMEIDKVYDILNKVIGEKTGVYIEFPNINSLQQKYDRAIRE